MKTRLSAECGVRSAESRGARVEERSAFTMIEIAICIAIIGFALVAIIGILPTGMNVQKDNRQETIVNQDASVYMDGLRNGGRGLDDLTNYVIAITNYRGLWRSPNGPPSPSVQWYTPTDSSTSPKLLLTNGFRIVGLMSTPKIIPLVPGPGFYSNHVVTFARSLSGPASEKVPQTNSVVQDLALSYRLISEVLPNFIDPSWLQNPFPKTSPGFLARSNYITVALNLQSNLHDLRLTFRWPLLPNGDAGPGRQIFRTMASGYLLPVNEPGFPNLEHRLYFLQPRTYVKAQ